MMLSKLFNHLSGNRLNLLSICLLLVTAGITECHGQQAERDVVYLKNGSVIRGQILELKKDTLVKIQTSDRSEWVFAWGDISHTSKEPAPALPFQYKTRGFYNASTIGFVVNSSAQEPGLQVSVNSATGYRFNRYLAAGLYTGFNIFDKFLMMPAGIDFRGDMLKGQVTPFYSFQGGMGWCLNPDANNIYYKTTYQPGLCFHPAIGLKFNHETNAFITEFGFEYQHLHGSYTMDGSGQVVEEDYIFRRLCIRFGFVF